MVQIPVAVEDWKALHSEAMRQSASLYQRALLGAIFGDEYLIHTANLLLNAEDPMDTQILEPIEKFLMTACSDGLRRYLIAYSFRTDSPDQLSVAAVLLVSTANMSIWPDIPRFARSQNVILQRCGATLLAELTRAGLPTHSQAAQMIEEFEPIDDEHVKEMLRRARESLPN